MRHAATLALLALSLAAPPATVLGAEFDPNHTTMANFSAGHYWITVEGATSGTPDACADGRCGDYLISVRNSANDPVPGSTVMIDFTGCTDLVLACDQLEASTGQTIVGRQITIVTNAAGQAVFRVQGAATGAPTTNNTTSPGIDDGTPCATAYADGVILGYLVVTAYDLNGAGSPASAVNSADASLALGESNKVALGAMPRARTDLNFSGSITAADASIIMKAANDAALGTGSRNTGPYCP